MCCHLEVAFCLSSRLRLRHFPAIGLRELSRLPESMSEVISLLLSMKETPKASVLANAVVHGRKMCAEIDLGGRLRGASDEKRNPTEQEPPARSASGALWI